MKTLFTLYVVFCFSLHSFAQKIYFTDPTNFWRVQELYTLGQSQQYYYYDYWYGADTNIGGTVYKKLLCSDSSRGYVREDTTVGIVLYYNAGIEDTLYNYNLNYGDTISYNISSSLILDKRSYFQDSVQVNSVYYEYFSLTCANCNSSYGFNREYSVMEGIGSLSGPLFPTSLGVCADGASIWNYDLLCFSQNNVAPVFSVLQVDCLGGETLTNSSTCGPTGVNSLPFAGNSVQVYPNPVKEQLSIETNIGNSMQEQVRISDVSGREVYSSYINENKAQIDIGNFTEGIYFIEISEKDAQGAIVYKTVKKIVKQ